MSCPEHNTMTLIIALVTDIWPLYSRLLFDTKTMFFTVKYMQLFAKGCWFLFSATFEQKIEIHVQTCSVAEAN